MNEEKIRKIVSLYISLFVITALLLGVLHYFYGGLRVGHVWWFNLDKERNLPTWFSGIVFCLFGFVSFAACFFEKSLNRKWNRPIFKFSYLWFVPGIVGLAMSLDEITILHENLFWYKIREVTSGTASALLYVTQWQIVFAPVILILFVYFTVFFGNRYLGSKKALFAVFSGIGCWVLALFGEGMRGTFKHIGKGFYSLEVVGEEILEIVGAVLITASVAFYIMDITMDLNEERIKRFSRGMGIFSKRDLVNLGYILSLIFFCVGTVIFFAQRLYEEGASLPGLQKRVLIEKLEGNLVRKQGVWFDDVIAQTPLSEKESREIVAAVTKSIFSSSQTLSLRDKYKNDLQSRIVFLSVSDGKNEARVFRGEGKGILAAVEKVLQAFRANRGNSKPQWVKIDFVQEAEEIKNCDPKSAQPKRFAKGIYGVAFAEATGLAFLPQEILANRLIDSKRKFVWKNVLRKVPEKKVIVELLQDLERVQCFLFTTESYYSDGKNIVKLYRGHRLFEDIPREELLAAAIRGGEYLASNISDTGRFVYIYLPEEDGGKRGYNILRHSGTVYSLLELYRATADTRFLKAAEKGIRYLNGRIKIWRTEEGEDLLCVVEKDAVKLGGNALAVLAIAEYIEATGDRTYLNVLLRLGQWIKRIQGKDGRYRFHKVRYSDRKEYEFRSEYYEGEALFALVRIYEVTGEESFLDAAERSARYIINTRDRGREIDELPHDHWFLYGIERLCRHRCKPIYINHSFKIAEAIIRKQNISPRYPDWYGGYYVPPRSTSAATRSEGLCAAYRLAKKHGFERNGRLILETVKRGVLFQLQTQLRPENTLYLKNPRRAIGGFRKSLTDYEVRIDYVQHNISSLLALYEIAKERSIGRVRIEGFSSRKEIPLIEELLQKYRKTLDKPIEDRLQRRMTRQVLEESLALGKRYLLNNQKQAGNFNYMYDFVKRRLIEDDNEVRQAGALWGLALLHKEFPEKKSASALKRGFEFFLRNSKKTDSDQRFVAYPGSTTGNLGTVSLLVLAYVEFLNSSNGLTPEERERYYQNMGEYLKFILSLRIESDGRFLSRYDTKTGKGRGNPSPYYDGESLLALIKAVRYCGFPLPREVILESGERMYQTYVTDALKRDRDSARTKGFYQWGSMAYLELYRTGWEGVEKYASRVIGMAYWMIDVHKTLKRTRNTAYAYEGMISAWKLAELTGDEIAQERIGDVIDRGLLKLTSWQVGSPIANDFLRSHLTDDPLAIGGVMNHRKEPLLRIDVTQHQMHALILARRYIYANVR